MNLSHSRIVGVTMININRLWSCLRIINFKKGIIVINQLKMNQKNLAQYPPS